MPRPRAVRGSGGSRDILKLEARPNGRRPGDEACLKIHLGEPARYDGRPAYQAAVERPGTKGLWGATVARGIYGFSKRSLAHSASALRLSEELPRMIEAVDSEPKVLAIVPELSEMAEGGPISPEDVNVLRHLGGRGSAAGEERGQSSSWLLDPWTSVTIGDGPAAVPTPHLRLKYLGADCPARSDFP
ncbi:MAG TPA: DUF190 domain-containing protein [Thermoplasmata archaeon]|nr:DUF190 domain-containing protein [Thermoplasmata archaeon]